MYVRFESTRFSWLLARIFARAGEIAYVQFTPRGLELNLEFPSDWHEHRRAWVRIGLGLVTIAFSFPWSRVVPDQGQCSGPRYGFAFHGDYFWLYHGKETGRPRDGSHTAIMMPWQWRHQWHTIDGGPLAYPYSYTRRSGEVQKRIATVTPETRHWTRPWIPWAKTHRGINIEFSDEVGERTGSWKGGCTGCGWDLLPGETPEACLRRMEAERKF